MKIYILTILLLSYVLSKRVPPRNMEFPNEIGKIKVTKALQNQILIYYIIKQ